MEQKIKHLISQNIKTSTLLSQNHIVNIENICRCENNALGHKGYVAIAITTSEVSYCDNGHSLNIFFGLKAAKEKRMAAIGFVSETNKDILNLLDHHISIPSIDTPRIQEGAHTYWAYNL